MINYQLLIDEAMLSIVKTILMENASKHLKDEQLFYISFYTKFPGVKLSYRVRSNHPQDITIVLEHQFKNLQVFEDRFTVDVSFDGVEENIAVPFKSITSFVDPVANFTLQFNQEVVDNEILELLDTQYHKNDTQPLQIDINKLRKTKNYTKTLKKKNATSGEIINFSNFHKKSRKT